MLARAVAVSLLAAACSGPAHHAAAPQTLVTARGIAPTVGEDAKVAPTGSPIERYLAGDRTFGAHPIDAPACEAAAWDATAVALGLHGSARVPRTATFAGTDITVGAMLDGITRDLQAVMTALRDAGRSDLGDHHVCIVAASGVGPALSTSNGFIAFDPLEILAMNTLIPDAERSMYSGTTALAHEFAHQIQYRYGDPFAGERTVRHSELAADCMGTAFVAMQWPSGWITDEIERGAVGALQAYADVKFASTLHHGTRPDRGRMAKDGVALVAAARAEKRALDLGTIKQRCEDAVRAWDASQVLTPPDQLWGGTE